jgi:hypothetical protein
VRLEADAALRENIADEARARLEVDAALQGNIDTETLARQQGDADALAGAKEYSDQINDTLTNHINKNNAHGIDAVKTDLAGVKLEITGLKESVENIDIVSIKGSVDAFADLPDPADLLEGTAYIVEEDENLDGITAIYAARDGSWEFIGKFSVDLSNYYTKQEAGDNFASKNTVIRNDIADQQNIAGPLSMGNNRITDIAAPANNNDAANKGYVDFKSGTVDYSTVEQDTGIKWIDGRPVYQITYTGSWAATSGWTKIGKISNFTSNGRLIELSTFEILRAPGRTEISERFSFCYIEYSTGDVYMGNGDVGFTVRMLTIKYVK